MEMKFNSVLLIHFLIVVKLRPTVAKTVRIGYFDESKLNPIDIQRSRVNYWTTLPFSLNNDYDVFPNRGHPKKKRKTFKDLTRYDSDEFLGDKFATDYIDISDLNRLDNAKALKAELSNANKLKMLKLLHLTRKMVPLQKDGYRFDISTTTDSESSENTESNSEDTDGSDDRIDRIDKRDKAQIPTRFQIINNSAESISDDEVDDSSDSSDKLVYIQAPGRFVDADDWRRRLPQFLPKRTHWDEKEYQNLRNYWIRGPRGRYARL